MPWIRPNTSTPRSPASPTYLPYMPTRSPIQLHASANATTTKAMAIGGRRVRGRRSTRSRRCRAGRRAGRHPPADPRHADGAGTDDDEAQPPAVPCDERAEAADDDDRGDRRDLDPVGHAQPGAVVAHHRPDVRAGEDPLLEPRARPREARRGDDEEHRRRQARHDDAHRADRHGDPAAGEPEGARDPVARAVPLIVQLTPSRSTTKTSVSPPLMSRPAPRLP